MGTVVEALKDEDRDTGLDISAIREISNYWEGVRSHYAAFESGMQSPSSEVYLHEMPGGQFTNLKAQARSMGLEERWHEVARAYADELAAKGTTGIGKSVEHSIAAYDAAVKTGGSQ